MKFRFLIVTFLYFAFISTGIGQYSIGIGSGLNRSTIKVKKEDQLGFRSGYYIKTFFTNKVNNKLSLVCDLEFSNEGFDGETGTIKLSYLRLIPHLGLTVLKNFDLQVGLNIGRKLSEKIERGEQFTMTVGESELRYYNNYDFGFIVGGKAYISNFFLSLQYNHGFYDVYLIDSVSINFTNRYKAPPWQNRTYQVGVGYVFNVSKKDK